MNERYIVIPNWDQYQHYKDQTKPAWIKLHTSLLNDDEWLNLTPGQRSALIGIWILHAKTSRKVSENTSKLSRQLGQRVTKRTLDALNQAGFIEFRSRDALEKLYAREEKRREEVSTPLSVAKDEGQRENQQRGKNGSGWIENLNSYTGCRYVRGEFALTAVHDVLGTERPPQDWPHPRPTPREIRKALAEKEETVA